MFSFVCLVLCSRHLHSLLATCLAANVCSVFQEVVDVRCFVLCLVVALAANGAHDLKAGLACAYTTSELVLRSPLSAACTECGSLPISGRRRIDYDF